MEILPFSDEKLWSILEQESDDSKEKEVYEIDVKKSLENIPENLIYYIANLGLSVKLYYKDLSFEEKEKFFLSYIHLNRVFSIQDLDLSLISIFFKIKALPVSVNSIFTQEEENLFIKKHEEDITKWMNFLDSVLLYQISLKYTELKDSIKQDYPIIEDKTIPCNIVNVLLYSDFCIYYNIIASNLSWYKWQFEESIYSGHFLFKYILVESNLVSAFLWNEVK